MKLPVNLATIDLSGAEPKLMRFELNGSGVGMRQASPVRLMKLAKRHNLIRPRLANAYGWANQPRTLRFSAESQEQADALAHKIRFALFAAYRREYGTSLSPVIYAYAI